MRKIFSYLLFYFHLGLIAQPPPSYYNYTYGITGLQDYGMSIKKCLNHFVIASASAYPGIAPDISVYKFDSVGNQIASNTVAINNKALFSYLGSNLNFYEPDTSYYVSGVINQNFSGSSITDALLFKFDKNLDTLWHTSYKTPNDSSIIITGAVKESDGLILYGQSKQFDWYGDGFLIKVDFNGNEMWRKTFQIANQFGGISKLIKLKNKDYITIENLLNYPGLGYTDIKVVKYDSLFTAKWSVIYNTPYEDYLGDIIELSDSNLMFSQGLGLSQFNPPWGTVYSRQTLTKIDKNNGSVKWQKSYGPTQAYIQLYNLLETPSQKIFALGKNTTPYASKPSGTEISTLLVVDRLGDSLNYQSTFTDSVSQGNLLYDLVPKYDGYYCTGSAQLAVMSGSVVTAWEQQNWLEKADTFGCFNLACAQTIDISENRSGEEIGVLLSPNPATGLMNIVLPKAVNIFDDSQKIVIYDACGNIVIKQKIPSNKFSLDLTGLKSGIYLCTIMYNNMVMYKERVIKE